MPSVAGDWGGSGAGDGSRNSLRADVNIHMLQVGSNLGSNAERTAAVERQDTATHMSTYSQSTTQMYLALYA